MDKYRFKLYWPKIEPSFEDAGCRLSMAYWKARRILQERDMIEKVDIYKGSKLIATFYK